MKLDMKSKKLKIEDNDVKVKMMDDGYSPIEIIEYLVLMGN